MTPGIRRLRAPAILLAALAALLVFAAAAAAETRTGESTTAVDVGIPVPEASLVKATASYDVTGGNAVFNLTTAVAPSLLSKGEIIAALTTNSACVASANPEALLESLIFSPPPLFLIEGELGGGKTEALTGSITAPQILPATATRSGATMTITAGSPALAGAGFNCAIVLATGEGEELEGASVMAFPISAPPPPPTPPTPPAPTAPPAPTPPPPVLSIGKLKPVSLKVGKSQMVRIKVTNTGGTGTGAGSVRVKAAKGVIVKPERQQIPALAPGKSWTVSVRVEPTAKAKKSSTLSVTAAASGLTAPGSIVVKLKE